MRARADAPAGIVIVIGELASVEMAERGVVAALADGLCFCRRFCICFGDYTERRTGCFGGGEGTAGDDGVFRCLFRLIIYVG